MLFGQVKDFIRSLMRAGADVSSNPSEFFRPFGQAGEFARSLGLEGEAEWRVYCKSGKKPADIPSSPNRTYKDKGWISWRNWLGIEWRPFEQARDFVRSLGLKNQAEWCAYFKSGDRPADIPSSPSTIYKDKSWISMGDWLGTGNVAPSLREFRPFPQAREFARSLGLKSGRGWHVYSKSGEKPADIPSCPDKTYKDNGWISMGDWLGTGRSRCLRQIKPFEQAREFARSLGLKGRAEWRGYYKSSESPADIPVCPDEAYKNNGWISWGD